MTEDVNVDLNPVRAQWDAQSAYLAKMTFYRLQTIITATIGETERNAAILKSHRAFAQVVLGLNSIDDVPKDLNFDAVAEQEMSPETYGAAIRRQSEVLVDACPLTLAGILANVFRFHDSVFKLIEAAACESYRNGTINNGPDAGIAPATFHETQKTVH